MQYHDLELKHIASVDDKRYFISTIKMHVRHTWLNQHDNVYVYETMIFKKEKNKVLYLEPIYTKRYDAYDKAISGHQEAIENIKNIVNKSKD
ncbi:MULTISPECIES: hypothetical protein [Malaciobacter]|jgi:hypothetical protein|uniref:Uncharacterized protein n=2 Tax=Malaciobacter TaxID=2321114 RepID=A0A1T5CKR7_9BACT|nr:MULTISPECIES: hypothetical protein [Malaciobacter]AXX87800.1 hypothetical protein AMRN_2085 [Malaciobacter marinus]PHO09451.1 hypothetical protein CPG37_09230 [Malaciobacter canalis]PHO12480.1 hypothetical protein CPG38_07810 [Malaciobacter marinus]PHO16510.1 hypothetical protein CPH92_01130 [Malaciobacter marinus]PPK60888.1 hypothetical protein B0F89_11557 [Malaciobacter marinus]